MQRPGRWIYTQLSLLSHQTETDRERERERERE